MRAALDYARRLMACGYTDEEAGDTAALYYKLDEYQLEDLRRHLQWNK